MAKLPTLWLQGASQRLAGAVVYQQAGRTLGRSLAQEISNPRTSAQMSQRIKLSNLVKLYQANRSWAKLSFETKPRTWSDYNAFVSANLAGANVALTKAMVTAGAAVVAPVKVTAGTLGSVTLRVDGDFISSNINTGAAGEGDMETIAEFTALILDNNNGLQEGDQFSFIQYIQQTDPQGFPFIICRPYEVILNRTDSRALADFMPTDILQMVGEEETTLGLLANEFTGGVAMVFSRTTASSTRVTTGYICLTPGNTVYPQYTSQAAADAARESYGQSEDIFLESRAAADTTGNISTVLSLSSVAINGTTVGSGQGVDIPLPVGTQVRFTFSQPLSEPSTVSVLQYQHSGGSRTNVATSTPVISGNTLTFTTTEAIGSQSWASGSALTLIAIYDSLWYAFNTSVSTNSMD